MRVPKSVLYFIFSISRSSLRASPNLLEEAEGLPFKIPFRYRDMWEESFFLAASSSCFRLRRAWTRSATTAGSSSSSSAS